jgi:paraquat-inducible protein B
VQLDFFDRVSRPVEKLSFVPARHYVPATDSSLKGIEDAVVRAADNLPQLTQELTLTVASANRLLGALEQGQLPQRAASTLQHADAVLTALQTRIEQVDSAKLSSDAHTTLTTMNQTLARVNTVLERMDGDKGFLASAQRASDSVGQFAQVGFGPEWGETLRDVSDAAESLRRLLDLLERDPDMLLKGRAKVHP